MSSPSSRLLYLCRTNPSFDSIRQWFEEHKENKSFLTEAVDYQDEFLCTPLHYLSEARPPTDLLDKILQLAPAGTAVMTQNRYGNMPLHAALFHGASFEMIQRLLRAYPHATEIQNRCGNLPLHIALYRNAPIEIINLIFEEYPKAVEVQDNDGQLPLHLAFVHDNYPVTKMIFEAYPEAAGVQDKEGCLPIHQACFIGSSLNVLETFLAAFPESIYVRNKNNQTPSDCFKIVLPLLRRNVEISMLKEAISHGHTALLIKLLLQAFPDSCILPDEHGNLPLHYACMKEFQSINMDTISLLVDAHPESCSIANKEGKTPKDLLAERSSYRDDSGMLLLHHMAAYSQYTSLYSLAFVVNTYPEGIMWPDKKRMLPFHYACLNSASSVEVLMQFLKFYPDSIQQKE